MGMDLAALKAMRNNKANAQQQVEVQQPIAQPVQQPIAQPVQQPVYTQPVQQQQQQVYTPPVQQQQQHSHPTAEHYVDNQWSPSERPISSGEWSPNTGNIHNANVSNNALTVPADNKSLYAILGLDPTTPLVVMQPVALSVEPIDFGEIRDRRGQIAERVKRTEQQLGYSVLPIEVAEVSANVVEVMGYDIIEFFDHKLLSGKLHAVSMDRVTAYVNEVADIVRDGLVFCETLKTTLDYNGKQYQTLRFNIYELNLIQGMLRNAQPEVVIKPSGECFLVVGHKAMISR